MYHRAVTFLGIFSHSFDDHMDVLLPRLRRLFQTIKFGLVISDKYGNITRPRAHLKPVTQSEPLSGFDISQMHNQNTFIWFGVIPLSQAESF